MNKIVRDIKNTKVYIDYLLVYSQTYQEHLESLLKILDTFKKNNIKINPEKSTFFTSSILYLGCEITQAGIKPQIDQKILDQIKSPNSKKGLQKF